MKIPKYNKCDNVYFSARISKDRHFDIFVMTITRVYADGNIWRYDMTGETYEIQGLPESRITNKCIK